MKSTKQLAEKQLRAQAEKLNAQLREIERTRTRQQHEALVGKCFKFHNSFGGNSPKWWLYAKVTAVGEWWPKAVTFQRKSDGCFEFQQREGFTSSESYTPISIEEFDDALSDFNEELRKVVLSVKWCNQLTPLFKQNPGDTEK